MEIQARGTTIKGVWAKSSRSECLSAEADEGVLSDGGLENSMTDEIGCAGRHQARIQEIVDRPSGVAKVARKTRRAQQALSNAATERRLARTGGGEAAIHLAEADRLESIAAELIATTSPPVVRSGEVVLGPRGSVPSREIVDTLVNPDVTAIEASVARTGMLLTSHADVVALAVDAANTAGARNSNEKMLAHQLATLHALTMKAANRAFEYEARLDTGTDVEKLANAAEFVRMAQTASRLSSVFQDGLIAQQRVQTGGSQTMTVRHVTVEAGGQAVIGNVKAGGIRDSRGRGNPK